MTKLCWITRSASLRRPWRLWRSWWRSKCHLDEERPGRFGNFWELGYYFAWFFYKGPKKLMMFWENFCSERWYVGWFCWKFLMDDVWDMRRRQSLVTVANKAIGHVTVDRVQSEFDLQTPNFFFLIFFILQTVQSFKHTMFFPFFQAPPEKMFSAWLSTQVAPLLVHPSEPIRNHASQVVESLAAELSQVDQCQSRFLFFFWTVGDDISWKLWVEKLGKWSSVGIPKAPQQKHLQTASVGQWQRPGTGTFTCCPRFDPTCWWRCELSGFSNCLVSGWSNGIFEIRGSAACNKWFWVWSSLGYHERSTNRWSRTGQRIWEKNQDLLGISQQKHPVGFKKWWNIHERRWFWSTERLDPQLLLKRDESIFDSAHGFGTHRASGSLMLLLNRGSLGNLLKHRWCLSHLEKTKSKKAVPTQNPSNITPKEKASPAATRSLELLRPYLQELLLRWRQPPASQTLAPVTLTASKLGSKQFWTKDIQAILLGHTSATLIFHFS